MRIIKSRRQTAARRLKHTKGLDVIEEDNEDIFAEMNIGKVIFGCPSIINMRIVHYVSSGNSELIEHIGHQIDPGVHVTIDQWVYTHRHKYQYPQT